MSHYSSQRSTVSVGSSFVIELIFLKARIRSSHKQDGLLLLKSLEKSGTVVHYCIRDHYNQFIHNIHSYIAMDTKPHREGLRDSMTGDSWLNYSVRMHAFLLETDYLAINFHHKHAMSGDNFFKATKIFLYLRLIDSTVIILKKKLKTLYIF